jgi:hypothetical protein
MPLATELEQRRFEQAQYQAALEAVGIAAETRTAFFSAVAAQDLVKYYVQVREAAEASNELARRMVQAGNFNKLAQMRHITGHAEDGVRNDQGTSNAAMPFQERFQSMYVIVWIAYEPGG